MTYIPKRLKRWSLPRDYVGERWPEHFTFLGRSRDSDLVEESNFHVGLAELGGESDTVVVVRESHWAVGWIEWVGIHESDADALAKADAMRERIEDYPLLDEDDYSTREWERASAWWEQMSIRDRVEACQRFGLCVFAARHAWVPRDDDGSLFQWLAE